MLFSRVRQGFLPSKPLLRQVLPDHAEWRSLILTNCLNWYLITDILWVMACRTGVGLEHFASSRTTV